VDKKRSGEFMRERERERERERARTVPTLAISEEFFKNSLNS
jgi:hypothetical protein